VEARGQDRLGEYLEEVRGYERIGQQSPGNSGLHGTDSLGACILEVGVGKVRPGRQPNRSFGTA
jgi:hypothetical protein